VSLNTAVGAARAAVSANGTLVYLTGAAESQLVVVDTAGAAQTLVSQAVPIYYPAWSPDGKRIAMFVGSLSQFGDIWMFDFASRALTRVTSQGASTPPAWSPDGKRLFYGSRRTGKDVAWSQPADGSGTAEKLFETEDALVSLHVAPD